MGRHSRKNKWVVIVSGLLLIGAFFLPWVTWGGTFISGSAMPSGDFFNVSSEKFGLGNPYPALENIFILCWIIPLASLAAVLLSVADKKTTWASIIAGVGALALVVIYIMFTSVLLDLGVGTSLGSSLVFGIYLTILSAIGLIIGGVRASLPLKLLIIILGPLMAWISFSIISKKMQGEKFGDTAGEQSSYTVHGLSLLGEFKANDSLANAKYREQILTVTGRISTTENPNDSTVNVKIADSTGSYLIFPLQDNYLREAKYLKAGDSIIIKGSCSGGIYSEILETEIVTFKRCAIIK